MKAIYPGTFDPPTLGHIRLITRAAPLFRHLIVAIGENRDKGGLALFDIEERIDLLKREVAPFPHVEVGSFSGLVADFAKKIGATVLIRGIRSTDDLEIEKQRAQINLHLGIETLFLVAEGEMAPISSTLIRELALHRAHLGRYLPSRVEKVLYNRLQKEKERDGTGHS